MTSSSRWHDGADGDDEAHADAHDAIHDVCHESSSEMTSVRKPSCSGGSSFGSSFGSSSDDEEEYSSLLTSTIRTGTGTGTPLVHVHVARLRRILLLTPCVASWYVACGSNAIAMQRFGARSSSQVGSSPEEGGGFGLIDVNLSAICFVTAVQLGLGAILGWIALSFLEGGGTSWSSWSRYWRMIFTPSPTTGASAGTTGGSLRRMTRVVALVHGSCSLLTNVGSAAYPSSSSTVAIVRMTEPCVTSLLELVASWFASGFSLDFWTVASSALRGGDGGGGTPISKRRGSSSKDPPILLLANGLLVAATSGAAIVGGGVLLFGSIPAPPVASAVAIAVLAVASTSARNVLYRRLLVMRSGNNVDVAAEANLREGAASEDVARYANDDDRDDGQNHRDELDRMPEIHGALLNFARISYHASLLTVGVWALCSTILLSPGRDTGAIPSTSDLSWRTFLYHPLSDLSSVAGTLHFVSAITHSVLNATRRVVGFSLALAAHREPTSDDVVTGLRLVAFGLLCHVAVRWRFKSGVDAKGDAKDGGGGNVNCNGEQSGTAADGTSIRPVARVIMALGLLVLLPLQCWYNISVRGRVRNMDSPAVASSKSALRAKRGSPSFEERDALMETANPHAPLEVMLASEAAGSSSSRAGDATTSSTSSPNNDTLVVIMGNLRGGEPAWRSLYRNVLDVNGADLALQVGELDEHDRATSMVARAKYVWETPEYDDWGDAIDLIPHPDGDGSGWRHFANATRGVGLFGGTAEDPTGSGAIIFIQRWYLSNNIRRLGLHRRYSRFVVTRSDHYYLCEHDLDSLTGSNVWVPSGSDWGGITDRHVVCSNETILPVLNILPPVIESPDRYEEIMVGPSAVVLPNPEALIRLRWGEEGILPIVRHFERVMFTCASGDDSSRWKQPDSFPGTPDGVLLKYSEEYFKSRKTCSKGVESGLDGILYGMYYFD